MKDLKELKDLAEFHIKWGDRLTGLFSPQTVLSLIERVELAEDKLALAVSMLDEVHKLAVKLHGEKARNTEGT